MTVSRSFLRLEKQFFDLSGLGCAVIIGFAVASLPQVDFALWLSAVMLIVLAVVTPLVSVIGLVALAPLRTLIATESGWPLPLDIGQLCLIAVIACTVTARIIQRKALWRARYSSVFLPVLLFTLIALTGLSSAQSLGGWLSEWIKWLQILFLIALVLLIAKHRQWELLIFGLVLACAANAVIGLYEFFGGSGAIHLVIEGRFFRAFGTFGQPNPFAGFMGLIAPVALMATMGNILRFCQHRKRSALAWSVFYLACSGLILAALLASWSRGSWLGCMISLAVVLLMIPRRWWQSLLMFAAGAALFLGLYSSDLIPESLVQRMASSVLELSVIEDVRGVYITPENYPLIERLAHWQAALNMAQHNPWFGVGLGNYETRYSEYNLMNWDLSLGHAHNIYLNVLAETGIIGLIGYLVMWLWIILLTWRTRVHPDPFARYISIGLMGTWVYLAIHGLTDNLYVNNLFLHIGVLLGVLAVLNHQIAQDVKLRYL